MADLDTRLKRQSASNLLLPFTISGVYPDTAGVSQPERQAVSKMYSGISAFALTKVDLDIAWGILNDSAQDTAWITLNSADQDIAWAISNLTTQDIAWAVQHVSTQDVAWIIKNSASPDISWAILNKLTQDIAWAVQHTSTQDIAWIIKNLTTQGIAWATLNSADQATAWAISNLTTQDTAWDVLNATAQDIAWLTWGSARQNISWSVFERILYYIQKFGISSIQFDYSIQNLIEFNKSINRAVPFIYLPASVLNATSSIISLGGHTDFKIHPIVTNFSIDQPINFNNIVDRVAHGSTDTLEE